MIYFKKCPRCGTGDVQYAYHGRRFPTELKCLACGWIPGAREPREDEPRIEPYRAHRRGRVKTR